MDASAGMSWARRVAMHVRDQLPRDQDGKLRGEAKFHAKHIDTWVDVHATAKNCCTSFEEEFISKPVSSVLPLDKLHKFPYTLNKLAPMTENSLVARRLYTSRFLSEKAWDAFLAGDAAGAVSLYAAAYRIDDLPVQWLEPAKFVAVEAFMALVSSDEHLSVHTDALLVLHFLFAMQGKGKEALRYVRDALQLSPDDPALHFYEGNLLHSLDRLKEADEALQRAIELGDAWEPYFVRGCVLLNMTVKQPSHPQHIESACPLRDPQLIADARAVLKEYIRQAPADERKVCEAYYHLAILEHLDGKPGAGRRYLDLGVAAEKARLSCFSAPPSTWRQSAEAALGRFHPCGHLACSELGKEVCSGCRKIRYCSPECQKKHWKAHKKDCKTSSK